jgi:glutaminyl-tRNA synthetase
MEFNLPEPADNIQSNPELLEIHLKETNGKVVTRFPPEPNGYLHLGHAKAMFINFTFSKSKNGICYMRFDDTNPSKEKQEYIDSILEDVEWLGHNPYKITYTSDYFEQLQNYAIELIKKDKAYICELDNETMKTQRRISIDSIYRYRPIEESLMLFNEMREGKHNENSMVLRLKCDMKSNNPNMRDLVAYRILFNEHPRTGYKYKIYPTYDFSHPIVDSLENITHSLCSMEFQTRNELYRWIPNTLGIYSPPQIEYSRLNITHTILSKRKLIEIVNDKIVDNWDDPRMPTIKGLRRRGYTPEAINDFCKRIGVSFASSPALINYKLLEECLRQDLDTKAPRVMAIMNPLKVVIVNMENNKTLTVNALDFPNLKENSTTHEIIVGNVVYIEQEDFRMQDSPKYYRLAPNKIVRLKYLGLIKCVDIKFNNTILNEIHVELLPQDYKPDKRIQGTLNWISDIDHLKIEVRKYEHLFPEELTKDTEWKNQLNINSKKINNIMTDTSIKNAKKYDKFQFERIGYFSVDNDTTNDNIIMNMVVELKESKDK